MRIEINQTDKDVFENEIEEVKANGYHVVSKSETSEDGKTIYSAIVDNE